MRTIEEAVSDCLQMDDRPPTTVKETIVAMLQSKGYGFFEACDYANETIKEARESLARGESYQFSFDNRIYEIKSKECND